MAKSATEGVLMSHMTVIEPKIDGYLETQLRENVLRRLGYNDNEKLDPKIAEMLREALIVAKKRGRPKGLFGVLPVQEVTKKAVVTSAGVIRSANFGHLALLCEGTKSILFMIATVGNELLQDYGPEVPLYRQAIMDAVASELTEIIADASEAEWKKYYVDKSGLSMSMRFSPGYCDMSLDQQNIIFNVLSAGVAQIGVSLNSNFVMTPSKSISGFAVIANKVPVPAPCVFCPKNSCPDRRLPFNPLWNTSITISNAST
jgi:hypothetical protein